MVQIFHIDHNDFAAEVADGNVSVNLTQMAKPFGKSKQPIHWLKTREAREYITALISYRSMQNSRLRKSILTDTQKVDNSKVGKSTLLQKMKLTEGLITVKNGGAKGEHGTWAHDYRIVMRFAQWLSPEFSIKVDELLVSLLRGTREVIENDCPYTKDLLEMLPAMHMEGAISLELLLDIMNDVCHIDDTALRTRIAAKVISLRKSGVQSV
ncbi:MAG: KilA-N domain-containing protein [Dysgonamonadaceae bacterium]|jgi:hypothetical protein|nr:KilA-N domain-containing protein [Dysgonamonadaceae bacterium]